MDIKDFGGKIKQPRTPSSVEKDEECKTVKEEDGVLKTSQWSLVQPGGYLATGATDEKLPTGIYRIETTNVGIVFSLVPSHCDDLIDFPSSIFDEIIREIEHFWTLGKTFDKYGFLHRRGYLLYGKAGSGKTCLIQRIIGDFLRKEGIIVLCSNRPGTITSGLKILRDVEPDRPLLCVFEDIDALIVDYSEETVLSLLDGELQVDKVVNIATTNHPEYLNPRIVARPRRFDRIIEINPPNKEIRKIYFSNKHKIGGGKNDIERWVELSENFSFAQMAELVVLVKCFEVDLEEAAVRLRKLIVEKPRGGDDAIGEVGFSKDR